MSRRTSAGHVNSAHLTRAGKNHHAFAGAACQAPAFSGAPGMTIAGTPLARNAALIEAGLDVSLSPSAALGIFYNAEIASDVEGHGVSGRLNWRF